MTSRTFGQISFVTIGNVGSKLLSVVLILVSIRYMPVAVYDEFLASVLIATYSYQLVSALVERCYILDQLNYSQVENGVATILSGVLLVLCSCLSYLIDFEWYETVITAALGLSIFYVQLIRFRCQYREDYKNYVFLDCLRNLFWLLALVLSLPFTNLTGYWLFLICVFVSANIALCVKDSGGVAKLHGLVHEFYPAFTYLGKRKLVIIYTLATALLPLIPYVYLKSNDMSHTDYGNALRYQSIFGIVILSFGSIWIVKLGRRFAEHSPRKYQIGAACLFALLLPVLSEFSAWLDGGLYPKTGSYIYVLGLWSIMSLLGLNNALWLSNEDRFDVLILGLAISIAFGGLVLTIGNKLSVDSMDSLLSGLTIYYICFFLFNSFAVRVLNETSTAH